MIAKLERILDLRLYLLSVVLIGLPPIFFVSSYLNVHTLAKLIWLGLFIALGIGVYLGKEKLKIDKAFLYFFLFYFISQSLSFIKAFNTQAFLSRYEDFFFASIFLVVSLFFINSKEKARRFLYTLLVIAFVNVIIQFFILTAPEAFLRWGRAFLHEGYLEIIRINIGRLRVYMDIYDEALIPVVFYLAMRKGKKGWYLFALLALIVIFSFVSNFRTRFLMTGFALFGLTLVYIKELKNYMAAVLPIGAVLIVVYLVFIQATGFTVIQRVFLEDKAEDVKPISSRVLRWKKSTEMGVSSPVFGVGLGNYYDYLDFSMKQVYTPFQDIRKEFELAVYNPHNIFFETFAETGLLGLVGLSSLLFYFGYHDYKNLLSDNKLSFVLGLGFWTLIIHALFNPAFTIKFFVYFWALRVLVLRSSKEEEFIQYG